MRSIAKAVVTSLAIAALWSVPGGAKDFFISSPGSLVVFNSGSRGAGRWVLPRVSRHRDRLEHSRGRVPDTVAGRFEHSGRHPGGQQPIERRARPLELSA